MKPSQNKQQYQAYVSATQTIAKTQQIIMLYDGVIRLVKQGKEAISEKRIEDRYHLLTKAADIIHGMQGCLDFDNGGEIAKILYSFYSNVDSRLLAVQRTNNVADCDEVIEELRQMRDAWVSVDESQLAESAPPYAIAHTEQTPLDGKTPSAPGNITISA